MAHGPKPTNPFFFYSPGAKNGFYMFNWMKNKKNNNNFRHVKMLQYLHLRVHKQGLGGTQPCHSFTY